MYIPNGRGDELSSSIVTRMCYKVGLSVCTGRCRNTLAQGRAVERPQGTSRELMTPSAQSLPAPWKQPPAGVTPWDG